MPPVPTLSDLLDLYATSYLTKHAPATQDQQRRLFRRFARDLGAVPLPCLTPLVLRSYSAHLRRTLKPGSVRHYDLRHTFASYMAMSGASLLVIGELLGHRSPAMTRRYAHLTLPYLAGTVEEMAAQFLREE